MNNYLSNLPDDIIDNIYYQLHKKYMKSIILSIPGAVVWNKIKIFHYYPLTFFDRVYYRTY